MYSESNYKIVKAAAYDALKTILEEDAELKTLVQTYADNNVREGASEVPLIELAFLWDKETGWQQDSKGCFRFHLVLNMDAYNAGDPSHTLKLIVSHVPMTDNGYDWDADEVHTHPADPATHRAYDCNQFIAFMCQLTEHGTLRRHLTQVIESRGTYKPLFIKRLERRSHARKRKLLRKQEVPI